MVIVPDRLSASHRNSLTSPVLVAARLTAQRLSRRGDGIHVNQAVRNSIARYQGNTSPVWQSNSTANLQQEDSNANQEAKAHRVGEWASLRNTSPEIAEAIFEVAHYDEKTGRKIWEEGKAMRC